MAKPLQPQALSAMACLSATKHLQGTLYADRLCRQAVLSADGTEAVVGGEVIIRLQCSSGTRLLLRKMYVP